MNASQGCSNFFCCICQNNADSDENIQSAYDDTRRLRWSSNATKNLSLASGNDNSSSGYRLRGRHDDAYLYDAVFTVGLSCGHVPSHAITTLPGQALTKKAGFSKASQKNLDQFPSHLNGAVSTGADSLPYSHFLKSYSLKQINKGLGKWNAPLENSGVL